MTARLDVVVVLGAAGGAGAWLMWTGWRPPVEPLAVVLGRFGQPAPERSEGRGSRRDLEARLARQVRRIGPVERWLRSRQSDLAILDRSADDVAAGIGAFTLAGLLFGVLVLAPRLAGLSIPVWVAGWIALAGVGVGAAYPLVELRDAGARRREAFQQAVSAYCVSVDLCLQVGAGPEQALLAAADGQGWPFARLRAALAGAQVRNEEPWVALRRLGEEVDLLDLVELARSVEQVAVKGASVGDTVAGIADSIQARIASAVETDATRRTVRMAIPTTMLLLGFMLLAIYPLVTVVFGAT
jgi:Flp pilus assembly protein TadB